MTTLIFTDECGAYKADRTDKYNRAHPFYVRANVMIPAERYKELEMQMIRSKEKLGISSSVEVKWAHYGNLIKGRPRDPISNLSVSDIQDYISEVVDAICSTDKLCVFFTLTENAMIKRVDEVKLIKMHLQNAFQRSNLYAKENQSYAIIIADDLNENTRTIKKSIFSLTVEGDQFMKYENVNKGLFVDISDQCTGLQIADLCAGIFTASLKYAIAEPKDRHKFKWANDILMGKLYKSIRHNDTLPRLSVYRYGIKEVPDSAGDKVAKEISSQISQKIENDLIYELMGE